MSKLREFLWILSMPCTQATRLISESLDRGLPWRLRVAVRVHQLSCGSCRRFRSQIEALRSALARRLEEEGGTPTAAGAGLSDEARERMRRALRESAEEQ